MPSESRKQHNFFEAIDHSKKFAREAGVSQETAHEFTEADKRTDEWKRKERATKKAGETLAHIILHHLRMA
jgi:hypothetical protein